MGVKQDETKRKGTFSNIRLAITKKYILPFSRKRMMLVGGIASVGVLLFFVFNTVFQKSSFISDGPLASAHANFEADCSQCHDSFRAVSNEKCSVCHEKAGDKLSAYTYTAHYIYRSGDRGRAVTTRTKYGGKEVQCAACHPDHQGRNASMIQVTDMKCISCHEYGSFNKRHPQFAFARNNIPDDSTLVFTHIRHTKFVLEKLQKQSGTLYVEKACLYCHNPQPDGKHFKPLDFDSNCGECHLTTASQTPSLVIKDPGNPSVPGVETLQMIQARRGPGTVWAFYTNPNEFTVKAGTKIVKSPVYHKDPWILENLTLIRRAIYDDLGLSELLRTSVPSSYGNNINLYSEAIQTLRDYATGLRSRPEIEVQSDLAMIDSLLKSMENKIMYDGMEKLPNATFSLADRQMNANLTETQKVEFLQFSERLTTPCRVCHTVANASILRVKSDQRDLAMAEFDHRAHILQRRCLDCHSEIPINQVLVDKDTSAVLRSKDRSSIQNIPKIENCFGCHNEQEAANQCVTCHYMHPNKDNRSSLQLFVENK